MKTKEIMLFWRAAKSFWIAGTLVWIIETIVFLIIEGWHLKATHPVEIWFDKLVVSMWTFALWLTVYTCVNLIIKKQ